MTQTCPVCNSKDITTVHKNRDVYRFNVSSTGKYQWVWRKIRKIPPPHSCNNCRTVFSDKGGIIRYKKMYLPPLVDREG